MCNNIFKIVLNSQLVYFIHCIKFSSRSCSAPVARTEQEIPLDPAPALTSVAS